MPTMHVRQSECATDDDKAERGRYAEKERIASSECHDCSREKSGANPQSRASRHEWRDDGGIW